MSAADWVEGSGNLKVRPLTQVQRKAVEVLCAGLGEPWNIRCKWKNTDWQCGRGVRFTVNHTLATFYFNHLTRLVIAAHDECMRVDIEAAAPGYLYIYVHPRNRDGDSTYDRHPTIEQAIESYRGVA